MAQARSTPLHSSLRSTLWLHILLLGGGLSLLLTCRRIAGALLQPPTGGALIAAALALAALAALLRRAAPRSAGSELASRWPGIIAILLLAALTLPGTPAWGIAIAWFLLVASEAMSWLSPRPIRPPRDELFQAADEPETPAGLLQQVTRIREENRESIHALIQGEIPAGDRLAVIHMAFCPPLTARPELTAHALDCDEAEIRMTQAETFGARIEVRLPRDEREPRGVLIEVIGSAVCPSVAEMPLRPAAAPADRDLA